ncbi:GNAT family N-acetyltransferase [Mucilaginibacter sp. L3T2-6]|uniref:GNAT family N-acetyltransferase n=1 Tax=Mucilaginibacter sp. L3T2-6 TaxID=3062491 RepID=UPI002675A7BE|nr:GNAT family N-acetyltransferase [Mucilaginibacter sp. L3T2-6]MDO3640613.1 GNAT family N-acetyltransferase [Mucilaginibacter sp. L3T2-6]MDV6213048.1 GNAT family N-acetyltransferase [Mucilaginibacter sp. L3T2-6]
MEHPLDNPAWNALETGNTRFAVGEGDIKYFHPEVSPFAALKENTTENLKKLYEIAPASSVFGVVTPVELTIPESWELITCLDCLQMVCETPARQVNLKNELVILTEEHVPAMLELTGLTNPGPFAKRTIAYGHYRGIFDGEQLVAMCGQRMNPKPYAEVSAVCTHPDHVGKGYAAQLILYQVDRIKAAGEIPFLHVLATNERAVKLYESLGFKTRSRMLFYVVKKGV